MEYNSTTNMSENNLCEFFDNTLNMINSTILSTIKEHIIILASYYLKNKNKMVNKNFNIDIIELIEDDNIFNEYQSYSIYKYIIHNNRGYNMLFDLIKNKYGIIPEEYIINNLIHYYINDIIKC